MKVNELFRNLSFGELSNLSLANDGNGTVKEAQYGKLIGYTNEALRRLYTRFLLKESGILLLQVEHITTYHLVEEYAESSESDKSIHYIKDLFGSPFEGDVLKVLSVADEYGRNRPLNVIGNTLSVFTPAPTSLQVLFPEDNRSLAITYQANHPKLAILNKPEHLLNQDVEIPDFLEGALKAYIAHKVFDHMNGQEHQMKAQSHFANYEMICVDAEARDLVNMTTATAHTKLEERGFI